MSRQRVQRDDIRIGSPLRMDVYDERGTLLLRSGHVIESERQRERLLEIGMFTDGPMKTAGHAGNASAPEQAASPLALLIGARRRLAGVLASRAERDISDDILDIAGDIALACYRNPDLALGAIILSRDGDYASRHAVDCAITCRIVGSSLEWDDAHVASLTAAALTMNVSIIGLQNRLHQQSGPLDDAQRTELHDHPHRSAEMLAALGVDDPLWLEVVRDHHEHLDGSGYPAGKQGDKLSSAAQLLAMADIYCAHVCERAYRQSVRPDLVMRKLYREDATYFDAALAQQFIKILGCYPPGTLVRLNNGDIAIVTHRGKRANQPRVSTVVGGSGYPLITPIRRNPREPAYAVEHAVDREIVKSLPGMAALWGTDAALE